MLCVIALARCVPPSPDLVQYHHGRARLWGGQDCQTSVFQPQNVVSYNAFNHRCAKTTLPWQENGQFRLVKRPWMLLVSLSPSSASAPRL